MHEDKQVGDMFMCGCSRNSENNTGKYPDIAAIVPSMVREGVKSMVLDCEAVAFERATGKILPFQVSTRHLHCMSQCSSASNCPLLTGYTASPVLLQPCVCNVALELET